MRPATLATLPVLAVLAVFAALALPRAAAAQEPAPANAAVDATLGAARAERLPTRPVEDRVAEGRAKGAGEAQVAAAAARALGELRAARTALVRGGHPLPDDAAVALGAQLVARGYTPAQLETVAHESRDGRRLLAAFDALASLQARGVAADTALARVEARLARRDAEASLLALAKP
jgi:hypothetical protein